MEMKKLIKKTLECFSTPKRLVLLAEEMVTNIILPSKVIRGPRVGCNEQALEGFLKSRSVSRDDLITKDTEKGQFYYVKLEEKTIYTSQILAEKHP